MPYIPQAKDLWVLRRLDIKFRAKAINDDFFKREWVYGYYTKELWSGNLLDVITDGANDIPIQVETLGQFTGFCDKNVKEIYEYDIVRVYAKDGAFNIVVKWSNESMAFMACYVDGNQSPFSWFTNLLMYELEVIGNIFENKQLLKGKQQ